MGELSTFMIDFWNCCMIIFWKLGLLASCSKSMDAMAAAAAAAAVAPAPAPPSPPTPSARPPMTPFEVDAA